MSIAPYISNIKEVPARKGDQFSAKAEWLGIISSRHDSVYNFTKTRGQVKTFVILNCVYNQKYVTSCDCLWYSVQLLYECFSE